MFFKFLFLYWSTVTLQCCVKLPEFTMLEIKLRMPKHTSLEIAVINITMIYQNVIIFFQSRHSEESGGGL